MNRVSFINVSQLKAHEAVNQKRLNKLLAEIKADGLLKHPVVVDKKTKVILDGHHRVTALKKLGFKKIPVFLVDYKSAQVRVFPRRKEIKVNKDLVIRIGLSNQAFPYKTTRHFLKYRPRNINIDIKKLRY